jgi:hypothetical protein
VWWFQRSDVCPWFYCFECQVIVRVAFIAYDPTVKKSSNRLDKAAVKARQQECATLQTQKKSSDLVGATLRQPTAHRLVAVMRVGPVGAASLACVRQHAHNLQWAIEIPTLVDACR